MPFNFSGISQAKCRSPYTQHDHKSRTNKYITEKLRRNQIALSRQKASDLQAQHRESSIPLRLLLGFNMLISQSTSSDGTLMRVLLHTKEKLVGRDIVPAFWLAGSWWRQIPARRTECWERHSSSPSAAAAPVCADPGVVAAAGAVAAAVAAPGALSCGAAAAFAAVAPEALDCGAVAAAAAAGVVPTQRRRRGGAQRCCLWRAVRLGCMCCGLIAHGVNPTYHHQSVISHHTNWPDLCQFFIISLQQGWGKTVTITLNSTQSAAFKLGLLPVLLLLSSASTSRFPSTMTAIHQQWWPVYRVQRELKKAGNRLRALRNLWTWMKLWIPLLQRHIVC